MKKPQGWLHHVFWVSFDMSFNPNTADLCYLLCCCVFSWKQACVNILLYMVCRSVFLILLSMLSVWWRCRRIKHSWQSLCVCPQWCCTAAAAGEPEVPQSADQPDAGGRWRTDQKHRGEFTCFHFSFSGPGPSMLTTNSLQISSKLFSLTCNFLHRKRPQCQMSVLKQTQFCLLFAARFSA